MCVCEIGSFSTLVNIKKYIYIYLIGLQTGSCLWLHVVALDPEINGICLSCSAGAPLRSGLSWFGGSGAGAELVTDEISPFSGELMTSSVTVLLTI